MVTSRALALRLETLLRPLLFTIPLARAGQPETLYT